MIRVSALALAAMPAISVSSPGRTPMRGSYRVTGLQPLSANMLAFPYEDLDRRPPATWRSSVTQARKQVSLLIDAVQVGVGGDTVWSEEAPSHGKYRIPPKPLTFGFTLKCADHATDGAGTDKLGDLLSPDSGRPVPRRSSSTGPTYRKEQR
jgi:hypothetical protein